LGRYPTQTPIITRKGGLLRRAIDLQYRLYDRMRHAEAARVAGESGRTGPFVEVGDSGYLLLVTFKRSGEPVPTPVMFSRRDGKVYFRSEPNAKVKRLRANRQVRIARSNPRGVPRSPVYEGTARELPPEEYEHAWRILRDGYSPAIRVYESTANRLPIQLTYVEISPVEET
jgi:PPOX class probable F420-dependent enzyme